MSVSSILPAKPLAYPGAASRVLWDTLVEDLRGSGSIPQDHVPLSLQGRCLVPDGIHVVCEAVALSARGLTVVCEAAADPGDALLVNFRGLGEIAGVVESRSAAWFVMEIAEPAERIAALAKRLAWSVRQAAGATERRVSARIDQNRRPTALKTEDGREIQGEMLDLSATGAAVRLGAAAPYFWVGQAIWLDQRPGRVRRHFPGGVGVEFDEACEVGDGQSLEIGASRVA